jgi:ADP-ribose pyrophosphatase YjhB (NUDIX family)
MALRRDLLEELGIVPAFTDPSVIVSEPNPETHGPGEFHVFVVTEWSGEPAIRNDEHDALGWFTSDEAARLDLADPALAPLISELLGDIEPHAASRAADSGHAERR